MSVAPTLTVTSPKFTGASPASTERPRWTLGCSRRAPRLDQLGDERRPARLMDGAESLAVVSVEVLVKEQVVAKVGIGLKLLLPTVAGAAAVFVEQKQPREP